MLSDRRDLVAIMRSIIVAAALLASPLAHAQEITDKTPCNMLLAAIDSEKSDRIRPFKIYIFNTMEDLDSKHTQQGDPGIMAQLSDEGRVNMAVVTVFHCRSYPKMTVYNSAAFVYRGIRDLQLELGTAK